MKSNKDVWRNDSSDDDGQNRKDSLSNAHNDRNSGNHGNNDDWSADGLWDQIREAAELARRLEELLDRIECALQYLRENRRTLPVPLPPRKSAKDTPMSTPQKAVFKRTSIAQLEVEPANGRGWRVDIDDTPEFRLSASLAHLLSLLAVDDGHSEDDFVAYKSLADLRFSLAKRMGRKYDGPAVNQLIYRLREAFDKQPNLGRHVIQTHRAKGARVNLLRRPPTVTQAVPA